MTGRGRGGPLLVLFVGRGFGRRLGCLGRRLVWFCRCGQTSMNGTIDGRHGVSVLASITIEPTACSTVLIITDTVDHCIIVVHKLDSGKYCTADMGSSSWTVDLMVTKNTLHTYIIDFWKHFQSVSIIWRPIA